MKLITGAPRGTKDILPSETYLWQQLEGEISKICREYCFSEIRVPTFEHTELFNRGVGGTTDVVQKEMYTFNDKGGRSVTLRPEGTASVVRAVLENGLYAGLTPLKLYYFVNCFRYEKPQAGRLREFHQFGVEVFGAPGAAADAEVISLAATIFKRIGIKDISLEINSIGCKTCRAEYKKALVEYFSQHTDSLCETCNGRLSTNPLRILDCKSPVCAAIAKDAPKITDYLCEDCGAHFEELQGLLKAAEIQFKINPNIVRGLDYYCGTVFEFVSTAIGAQGTVCGGGRYDGLSEELGGPALSGLGFALGMERLILASQAEGENAEQADSPDIYIASMQGTRQAAVALTNRLRELGICAETDISDRSLKAQLKYADKRGARYNLVIGEDELASGSATLKDMRDGAQTACALDAAAIKDIIVKR